MGAVFGTDKAGSATSAGEFTPPKDVVVDEAKLKSTKGAISVAARYCNTRPLSADYKVEPKIVGSGMSGPVSLATGLNDGRKYAVKSFKKNGLSSRKKSELKNEVEIYMQLDHPHIARLEKVYETDDEIHIVMEYMAGGELYDRLSASKRYSEQSAASTTRQMLLAVGYLHANECAHRDLKLENFLYETKESDQLKLIDFGFAKFWDRNKKMEQACGSVHYVAPEVLAHAYTEKADLWSIGVIVYMLLTGSPPFHGSDDEVLKKIKAGRPQWSSRFGTLSETAQGFTRKLLVLNPEVRMSASEALEHPFLNEHASSAEIAIDFDVVKGLRNFAHASHFRRAIYTMMAWSLTMEHRLELEKLFLAMDTEHRGTITHSQLANLLTEKFHIESDEIDALFQSLDTDADDKISYTEFMAATLEHRISLHEDVLRKTFSRFDSDQSGMISLDDLKKVLGAKFEETDLMELITEADVNKDGVISYDEFLEYFHKTEEDLASTSRDQKKKRTEKLGAVLDELMPEHSDLSSPTHCGAKTPSLNRKDISPKENAFGEVPQ